MKSLVIAPHPDDEVLGPGGTLLRRKAEGALTAWVIVTEASKNSGWTKDQIRKRNIEIDKISELFNFDQVYQLGFETTKLDTISHSTIVKKISECINSFEPEEVFIPHPSDVHSDHRIVSAASVSSTKWFRSPSVKKVLAYETLSETEMGLNPVGKFNPNVFIDVTNYLEQKLMAMSIYESEIADFPFPRSKEAISSLAKLRGSASGYLASEAFELLKERD